MPATVLQATQLTKKYGEDTVLENLNLSVSKGEVVGVFGSKGAGKSTLIKILTGYLRATSGRVEILGELVDPDHSGALRLVGSLKEHWGHAANLTGRSYLEMLARIDGLPESRVVEALYQVGMAAAASSKFNSYSLGMKRRIDLAASLLYKPALLLLDEPGLYLEADELSQMCGILRNLAEKGTTIVLTSSMLQEVEQACDRVIVLRCGKIVAEGKVSELLGNRNIVKVWLSAPDEAARLLQVMPGVRKVQPNRNYVEVEGMPSENVIQFLVMNGMVPSEVTYHRTDIDRWFYC